MRVERVEFLSQLFPVRLDLVPAFLSFADAIEQGGLDGFEAGDAALSIAQTVERLDHGVLLALRFGFPRFDIRLHGCALLFGFAQGGAALRFGCLRLLGLFGKLVDLYAQFGCPAGLIGPVRLQALALAHEVGHALLQHFGGARVGLRTGGSREQFILHLRDRAAQAPLLIFGGCAILPQLFGKGRRRGDLFVELV